MINDKKPGNKIAESFTFNMKAGKAKVDLMLKGEPAPITITLNYTLDGTSVNLSNVNSNKEWVNALSDIFKDKYSRIKLGKNMMVVDLVKRLF